MSSRFALGRPHLKLFSSIFLTWTCAAGRKLHESNSRRGRPSANSLFNVAAGWNITPTLNLDGLWQRSVEREAHDLNGP